MPSIAQVIERVSEEKPNSMSDREMARWLLELDGKLYYEFFHEDTHRPPMEYGGNNDVVLLLNPPYDVIYDLYLHAMVHYAVGDTEEYYNAMTLFNEKMTEFKKYYRREHMPLSYPLKNYM